MSKYQAYEEYKHSGVDSQGRIPATWQVKKLAYTFSKANAGEVIDKTYWGDGEEVLYTCNRTPLKSDFSQFPDDKRTQKNDLLLTRNGTPYVHKPIANAIYSNVVQRVTLKDNFDRNYLSYCLGNSARSLKGYGVSIESFNFENWKSMQFSLPSRDEQAKIVEFLDHETTKIDTLIDKQQQLIKLLKEKRQAVISHAVTKGLNPDAPMKDSGAEWLGEVPEHWDVKKAKYLFDFVTSGSRGWAEYYADSGSLFFRIANLTRDTVEPKLSSIQYVQPPKGAEGERSKIRLNDLLISITADLGSVCVANESIANGYVSQHVALCRPNNQLVKSSRWLAYFVLSDTAKEQLLGSGYGGTKVQLSLEDIRELVIAFPPQEEQLQIDAYIDTKLSQFENLMQKAYMQVDLLQERRTALISAAVTGKIDVRNWQAPVNLEAQQQEAN